MTSERTYSNLSDPVAMNWEGVDYPVGVKLTANGQDYISGLGGYYIGLPCRLLTVGPSTIPNEDRLVLYVQDGWKSWLEYVYPDNPNIRWAPARPE